MRPVYETPADLLNEQTVVAAINSAWGGRLTKMPVSYRLDYFFESGDKRAVIEIKVRSHRSIDYPTYMLGLGKWVEGVRYHSIGIPFVLVVAFTDAMMFYLYHEDTKTTYKAGGRNVMRDSADREPCAYIPLGEFRKL